MSRGEKCRPRRARGRAEGRPSAGSLRWQNTGGSYEDRPGHELDALPEGCDTVRLQEERCEREAMDAAGLARLNELATEGRLRSRQRPKSAFECAVRRAERRELQTGEVKRLTVCEPGVPRATLPATPTATDGDSRENDPAFQNAPESEKERLREAWAEEDRAKDRRCVRQRRIFHRTLLEGTILFAMLGVFVGAFLGVTLPLVCCGPAAGFLWHITRADRIGHAWIGMALYFAAVTPFIVRQVLNGGAMLMAFFCLGALLTGYVCSARGLRAEMREQEGF